MKKTEMVLTDVFVSLSELADNNNNNNNNDTVTV